jgi:hypothetical protein
MLAGAVPWTSFVLTYRHACPPDGIFEVCVVIGCLRVCAPSVCCIIKTLGEVRGRPAKKGWACLFGDNKAGSNGHCS